MQSNSDKINWEQEIAKLLSDLSNVQEELLSVLMRKREMMVAGDVQQMQSIQELEENLHERLQACHEKRNLLLQSATEEGHLVENISDLAKRTEKGSDNKLGRQVKTVNQKMRILRHHSLTNWVLAQRTLIHLSQMLEIIATGGRLQPTYGKGESLQARGALVDREV